MKVARDWMQLSLDVDSVSPNAVMEVLAMLAVLMIQGRSLSCMAATLGDLHKVKDAIGVACTVMDYTDDTLNVRESGKWFLH